MRKVCQNNSVTFLSVIGMTNLSHFACTRIYNIIRCKRLNAARWKNKCFYFREAFSTIHL